MLTSKNCLQLQLIIVLCSYKDFETQTRVLIAPLYLSTCHYFFFLSLVKHIFQPFTSANITNQRARSEIAKQLKTSSAMTVFKEQLKLNQIRIIKIFHRLTHEEYAIAFRLTLRAHISWILRSSQFKTCLKYKSKRY